MAKFSGVIGYAHSEKDVNSGIVKEVITERKAFGDVVRNSRLLSEGEHLHDDLSVNNSISIVADAYASQNYFAIRFVEWAGSLWKVTDVTVERPRLILRLGGVYNGKRAAAATPSTP